MRNSTNVQLSKELISYMEAQARLRTPKPKVIAGYLDWQREQMRPAELTVASLSPDISEIVGCAVESERQYLKPASCFANALSIAVTEPRFQYVEGYVLLYPTKQPIIHAWNVFVQDGQEFHFDVTAEVVKDVPKWMMVENEYLEVMRLGGLEAFGFQARARCHGPFLFDKFQTLKRGTGKAHKNVTSTFHTDSAPS